MINGFKSDNRLLEDFGIFQEHFCRLENNILLAAA